MVGKRGGGRGRGKGSVVLFFHESPLTHPHPHPTPQQTAASTSSPHKGGNGYTVALLAAIMGNVLEFYDFRCVSA